MDFFYSTISIHQDCPISPYLCIICKNALSHTLQKVTLSHAMDSYVLASRAQLIPHQLYADSCLVVGWASAWKVIVFRRIITRPPDKRQISPS